MPGKFSDTLRIHAEGSCRRCEEAIERERKMRIEWEVETFPPYGKDLPTDEAKEVLKAALDDREYPSETVFDGGQSAEEQEKLQRYLDAHQETALLVNNERILWNHDAYACVGCRRRMKRIWEKYGFSNVADVYYNIEEDAATQGWEASSLPWMKEAREKNISPNDLESLAAYQEWKRPQPMPSVYGTYGPLTTPSFGPDSFASID